MSNEPYNKFQNAINRATAVIGIKASVIVGSAKIKTQITNLQNEITNLKLELGGMIFESWQLNNMDFDLVDEKCAVIQQAYKSIEILNTQLQILEQEESDVLGSRKSTVDMGSDRLTFPIVCPNCKEAYDYPLNFCRKCGTRIIEG